MDSARLKLGLRPRFVVAVLVTAIHVLRPRAHGDRRSIRTTGRRFCTGVSALRLGLPSDRDPFDLIERDFIHGDPEERKYFGLLFNDNEPDYRRSGSSGLSVAWPSEVEG